MHCAIQCNMVQTVMGWSVGKCEILEGGKLHQIAIFGAIFDAIGAIFRVIGDAFAFWQVWDLGRGEIAPGPSHGASVRSG